MPQRPVTCRFDADASGLVPAGTILCQTELGYLIQAATLVAGELVMDVGHWMMFPWDCTATPDQRPAGWDETEAAFFRYLFGDDSAEWPPFFWYYLHGREVGRTQYHQHGHIVQWRPGFSGVGQWTLEIRYSDALARIKHLEELAAAARRTAGDCLAALEVSDVTTAKTELTALLLMLRLGSQLRG